MAGESDEDEDNEGKAGEDMDEEDTVQINMDDMDKFTLPGTEETEKEGTIILWAQPFTANPIDCKFRSISVHFFVCLFVCLCVC